MRKCPCSSRTSVDSSRVGAAIVVVEEQQVEQEASVCSFSRTVVGQAGGGHP